MNFILQSVSIISLLASISMGGANIKATTQDNPAYAVETVSLEQNLDAKPAISTATVEDVVKDYFKDVPVLAKVAKCESQFRQVDKNGDVLRGVQNSFDVGVMQINEKYHLNRSEKMDINIYTLGGNLEYARALYNESGTAPWSSSKACWSVK
jgi:outer membrane receptor for ferrienterochelin and colicin